MKPRFLMLNLRNVNEVMREKGTGKREKGDGGTREQGTGNREQEWFGYGEAVALQPEEGMRSFE